MAAVVSPVAIVPMLAAMLGRGQEQRPTFEVVTRQVDVCSLFGRR